MPFPYKAPEEVNMSFKALIKTTGLFFLLILAWTCTASAIEVIHSDLAILKTPIDRHIELMNTLSSFVTEQDKKEIQNFISSFLADRYKRTVYEYGPETCNLMSQKIESLYKPKKFLFFTISSTTHIEKDEDIKLINDFMSHCPREFAKLEIEKRIVLDNQNGYKLTDEFVCRHRNIPPKGTGKVQIGQILSLKQDWTLSLEDIYHQKAIPEPEPDDNVMEIYITFDVENYEIKGITIPRHMFRPQKFANIAIYVQSVLDLKGSKK